MKRVKKHLWPFATRSTAEVPGVSTGRRESHRAIGNATTATPHVWVGWFFEGIFSGNRVFGRQKRKNAFHSGLMLL